MEIFQKKVNFFEIVNFITACIRRMEKVLFSQVSAFPDLGGYPSPRFFPMSLVPGPFWGGGVPQTWPGAGGVPWS